MAAVQAEEEEQSTANNSQQQQPAAGNHLLPADGHQPAASQHQPSANSQQPTTNNHPQLSSVLPVGPSDSAPSLSSTATHSSQQNGFLAPRPDNLPLRGCTREPKPDDEATKQINNSKKELLVVKDSTIDKDNSSEGDHDTGKGTRTLEIAVPSGHAPVVVVPGGGGGGEESSSPDPVASLGGGRPPLRSSKSVPVFDMKVSNDDDEYTRGSCSDLSTSRRSPEAGLNTAKSYLAPLLPSQEHQSHLSPLLPPQEHQSTTPRSGGGGSIGGHKVKFVDREEGRSYSSCDSQSDDEKIQTSSPARSISWMGKTSSPGRRKNRNRKVSEASSVSSVASASSGASYSYAAQDGGYGWVVVAASFFVNMIADGVGFSFGVMFDEFEEEFGCSKAATAGVISMFHAVPLLTGPLATYLTDRFGCRKVTILGSILASAGFFLAALSHHIVLLYLFFGVVAGFGLSMCYVAAIIIVAYYFDRRRSFATGISVCGSGVGTFVFAPFTQYLLDSYSGWRGACIVLSGIFLNMCICGMLFRELSWTKKKRVKRAESSRSLSNMPEIAELRQALEDGDVSMFLDSEDEEPRLTSSLITIPTYIKNPAMVPTDVLNLLANNKQTYHYILHNFPHSLIAHSISGYALEKEAKDAIINNAETMERKEPSKGAKLARRVSSLLKGPKSILKERKMEGSDVLAEDHSYHSVPIRDHQTLQAVQNKDQNLQTAPPPLERNRHTAKQNYQTTTTGDDSAKILKMKQLRVRRQSFTCKGSFHNNRHGVRSSSCPDISNSVIPHTEAEPGVAYLRMLTIPFLIFCLSNCILYFWYDVPYVYTIEFVESRMNINPQESTQVISIIGILNTIGEVIIGWFGDRSWISTPLLYAFCMLCCGISSALIPIAQSFPLVLFLSAVYGFCISANYSLTSPILVELVSLERFSSAYGFLLATQGIANLVGPVFAGWLYDFSKEWYLTFGLAGFFIGFSGLMLLVIPAVTILSRMWKKKKNSGVTSPPRLNRREVEEEKLEINQNICGETSEMTGGDGCDHKAVVV